MAYLKYIEDDVCIVIQGNKSLFMAIKIFTGQLANSVAMIKALQ